MEKQRYYACKRMRLLEYLLDHGFEPVGTQPDATNYRYKNWLFENTAELDAALREYFNK